MGKNRNDVDEIVRWANARKDSILSIEWNYMHGYILALRGYDFSDGSPSVSRFLQAYAMGYEDGKEDSKT